MRVDNLIERIDAVSGAGMGLMYVGEYEQALPYLQEAEALALKAQSIGQQTAAIGLQSQCAFRLDRWDEVLALEEKWRDLERRFPAASGPTCFNAALSGSVHALRGDIDASRAYGKVGRLHDFHVWIAGNLAAQSVLLTILPLKARASSPLSNRIWNVRWERPANPSILGRWHDHDIYMTLADTAVELRDADALRKYAPRFEELASRDNHRLYLAVAHRALGLSIGWPVNASGRNSTQASAGTLSPN